MRHNNSQPTATTKHGEISLDDLGDIQPGLGRLMPEVGERFWILYYAAEGGNWGLAQYQLNQVRNLFKIGMKTRAHMADHLNAYQQHFVNIEKAIEAEDFSAFKEAFKTAANAANAFHKKTGHAEIEWQLPPEPPKHLNLNINPKERES